MLDYRRQWWCCFGAWGAYSAYIKCVDSFSLLILCVLLLYWRGRQCRWRPKQAKSDENFIYSSYLLHAWISLTYTLHHSDNVYSLPSRIRYMNVSLNLQISTLTHIPHHFRPTDALEKIRFKYDLSARRKKLQNPLVVKMTHTPRHSTAKANP